MPASTAQEIMYVALGGAAGCVCRYAAEHIRMFPEQNFNTVVINLTGCLLIGILWVLIGKFNSDPSTLNRLLITGLLGGFTTFSAFSLHPILMMRAGEYLSAGLYVGITVVGGLMACFVGMWITEQIVNR